MKKLVLLSAAAIAFGLAIPQMAQAKGSSHTHGIVAMDEVNYKEISVEELPAAVTSAISADYAGYKVEKAYKGDDGSFKVKVANESGIKYKLFYSADGKLTKVEQNK